MSLITLLNIQKHFTVNAVHALSGADLSLERGEIHALVGENGAGKSTLMHLLAGYLRPSSGRILVDGRERRFNAPADALKAGIGMLRQHPALVPEFAVWEACTVGAEGAFLLNPTAARKRVAALNDQWGFDLPLDHAADTLPVSQRQLAAVLNLLLRGGRLFIFDEVTAVLSRAETEALFGLLRRLKREGYALALISHKIDETLALADRVTVLRAGKTICTRAASSLNRKTLNALMFGQPEQQPVMMVDSGSIEAARRPPLLSVRDLVVEAPERPFLRGVTMEVAAGGITGIAGVRDSGLETLELSLAGFLKPSRGTVVLQGKELSGGVRAFREAGGAYVGADRTGVCLAMTLPIGDSLVIHAHRRSRLFLNRRVLEEWGKAIITRASLERSIHERADSFSGGQLQRLVIERELAENPKLLIVAEAGWGLDARSRAALYAQLRAFVEAGAAVILFSTDVDELLSLSDTILTLRNGVFSAEIPIPRTSDDGAHYKARVIQAMSGITHRGD
jgi:simple sugar transport system ATP-binding protein